MSGTVFYALIICAGFGLGLLVRARPRLGVRGARDDAFYELVLVRALKKQRRLPVFVDNYMLDTGEQCMPPGFPVLLSLLPKAVAWRWPWLVNPVLDAGVGAGLGCLLWAHSSSVLQVLCAMLAWAFAPALVRTCSALNRRILGNTLLVLCMLLTIQCLLSGGVWPAVAVAVAGAAMFLSHRRSAHAFVFTVLGLAVWRQSWSPVGLLGLVFGAALVLSAGFYLKVFRGNIQWLEFRRRNWKHMGAHMVYGSPAYSRDAAVGAAAAAVRHVALNPVRGLAGGAAQLLARNYLLPVFLIVAWREFAWWTEFERLLAAWAALTYLWAALTAFVPQLRFMGAEVRYEKMAAFPMIYLTVGALGWGAPWWLLPLFAAALALNARQVARLYKELSQAPPAERGLGPVLDALRQAPEDGVLILPPHVCDRVVLETGKKVFWGGHGGGFARLEEFSPVLRRRVEEFFMRYNLSFLLLDTEYMPPESLGLDDWFDPVISSGHYTLYRYHHGPAPAPAE
jgi:hypothetical protein